MNWKKILAIFFVSLLLFGCINLDIGDQDNDDDDDNGDDDQNQTVVNTTVILGNEQNTTNVGGDDDDNDNDVDDGYNYDPSSSLSIYFLDIAPGDKQGEAILVKKGEYEMLIDAGPTESGQTVVNFLDGRVEGNLEIVVLTHDDEEHWGGASTVLNNFNVEEVWLNKESLSPEYTELIMDIEDKGISILDVKKDYIKNLNGASLLVMNPEEEKPANDESAISMRLTHGSFCILFLSDTVYGSQSKMIDSYDLECEVMQIPDSGLGTGNTQLNLLLLYVKPATAIITGNEDLGQVSNAATARDPTYQQIEWADAEMYTTFPTESTPGGNIKVSTDGNVYTVNYME